jgi:formamidopyrimidine-DNA glycosylase
MPELPEVEVLVRHLAPLLKGKTIARVQVHRTRVLRPTTAAQFERALRGATFQRVRRRGKYLLFTLRPPRTRVRFTLLGHLGMTGRMYLQPCDQPLPKHAAVTLDLGLLRFIYEDTRYFGRLTLDTTALNGLGPEILEPGLTMEHLTRALKKSSQPIKVKLLDQSVAAGIGNIYANEALFRACISPRTPSSRLTRQQVRRLRNALHHVLRQAIHFGSTVPLDWAGDADRDKLFYYGRAPDADEFYEERLLVYDRAGEPCRRCGAAIKRVVQGARSTFYCPRCQRG